ncbi:MAG: hypothetical protein KAR47_12865 [Planctomycetes bacterium]|nr:hypothetical protein [Planctomycetota bacterium]
MTKKHPIDISPITARDLKLRRDAFLRAKLTVDRNGVCDGLAAAIRKECSSDIAAVSISAPQTKKTPAPAEPLADAKTKRRIMAPAKDAAEI